MAKRGRLHTSTPAFCSAYGQRLHTMLHRLPVKKPGMYFGYYYLHLPTPHCIRVSAPTDTTLHQSCPDPHASLSQCSPPTSSIPLPLSPPPSAPSCARTESESESGRDGAGVQVGSRPRGHLRAAVCRRHHCRRPDSSGQIRSDRRALIGRTRSQTVTTAIQIKLSP